MKTTKEKVLEIKQQHPEYGRVKISKLVGVSDTVVRRIIAEAGAPRGISPEQRVPEPAKPHSVSDVLDTAQAVLGKGAVSPATLAATLNISVQDVPELLKKLTHKLNIECRGGLIYVNQPAAGRISLDIFGKEWVTFGLVSDTHLACQEERLDALHAQYEIFRTEGITTVFHAGNIVDGYIEKINGTSVICSSADDQCQYVIDNYPKVPGILTHFITGDDHESWLMKGGFNFGRYLEMLAIQQGRTDLHYIGHIEADVELKAAGGSAIMKIQHPGGGSSYARSYTGQKQVESFEGGEKPQILVQGHYHVSNFMQERNIYVISMPGFQDQTIFARKKRLRMEVGGAILKIKQNPKDGAIMRCAVEFTRFFDRGYYKPFLRSDKPVMKNHLTIPTK